MLLGKRRGIGRASAEGLAEAKAVCFELEQTLEALARKRVGEMARVMGEMRDGWRRRLENDLAFVVELTAVRAGMRTVRGKEPVAAAPARMRFQASTLFLKQCHSYLSSDPQQRERMILVSGTVTADGLRVLSHIEKVTTAEQNAGYVKADAARTHQQLVELTERDGHELLAMFHSHIAHGAESTQPSRVDLANQDRFVAIGWDALGGIFSLDGFVRLFSTVSDFEFALYGRGGSVVSDAAREKIIQLDVAEA